MRPSGEAKLPNRPISFQGTAYVGLRIRSGTQHRASRWTRPRRQPPCIDPGGPPMPIVTWKIMLQRANQDGYARLWPGPRILQRIKLYGDRCRSDGFGVPNCLIRKPPLRTIPTWRSDIGRLRAVGSTSEFDTRHGNGQGYFPIARSGTENGRVCAVRHGIMERWLGRSLSSSREARASFIQFSSGSHSSADLQSVHARKHSHLAVALNSAFVTMRSPSIFCPATAARRQPMFETLHFQSVRLSQATIFSRFRNWPGCVSAAAPAKRAHWPAFLRYHPDMISGEW